MSRTALFELALRIREFISRSTVLSAEAATAGDGGSSEEFNQLAWELCTQQLAHNPAYRTLCRASGAAPDMTAHWSEIPAVPTSAFKELAMTCLPSAQRTAEFRSSGTTGQAASRHYHCPESLALYEHSLVAWFDVKLMRSWKPTPFGRSEAQVEPLFLSLTPSSAQAPHSSLAHMFHKVSQQFGGEGTRVGGRATADGSWEVDAAQVEAGLSEASERNQRVVLLGTAFNFVHLLDYGVASGRPFKLPAGSWLLETGGYKGRSRSLPKHELHSRLS